MANRADLDEKEIRLVEMALERMSVGNKTPSKEVRLMMEQTAKALLYAYRSKSKFDMVRHSALEGFLLGVAYAELKDRTEGLAGAEDVMSGIINNKGKD